MHLVLLDEEAESLRYFFGAKLHASTLPEKYERRSPRALKFCIKKVTKIVTELPEIPNDLPRESELLYGNFPFWKLLFLKFFFLATPGGRS